MKNIEYIKDKQFLAILFEVRKEVLKIFGQKLIQLILYGSYARKQENPESDIDIMILVDMDEETLREYRAQIVNIMTDLSLKYDRLISFTRESHERYLKYLSVLPFFQNVYQEGVEIYGKHPG